MLAFLPSFFPLYVSPRIKKKIFFTWGGKKQDSICFGQFLRGMGRKEKKSPFKGHPSWSQPWKIKQACPDRAARWFFTNSWLRVDQGCDLAKETQGKGRVWVWRQLMEKTQLTLQMPLAVCILQRKWMSANSSRAMWPPLQFFFFQSNRFRSRDGIAVVFQKNVYAIWTPSSNPRWPVL